MFIIDGKIVWVECIVDDFGQVFYLLLQYQQWLVVVVFLVEYIEFLGYDLLLCYYVQGVLVCVVGDYLCVVQQYEVLLVVQLDFLFVCFELVCVYVEDQCDSVVVVLFGVIKVGIDSNDLVIVGVCVCVDSYLDVLQVCRCWKGVVVVGFVWSDNINCSLVSSICLFVVGDICLIECMLFEVQCVIGLDYDVNLEW